MNPGFKYQIDQNVLRAKLLESTSNNMEQAWEKFEGYLSQQKPIFTGSKKTRINLMIQPTLLLRGFLAALIILSSIFLYQQFDAKTPAPIEKAYSATVQTNKQKTTEIQKPVLATQPQPQPQVAPVEASAQNPVLNSAPLVETEPVQKKSANKTNIVSTSNTNKAPKNRTVQTAQTPSVAASPAPEEMVVTPQAEEPAEFVENPL